MALIPKKTMNFAYGMGAAVVIVGALFKIQHWTGASELLVIGLLTEAFIFGLSAFDPLDTEYKWENVYPQLVDESASPVKGSSKAGSSEDVEGMLSKKLDAILKEAKIDSQLMESLGNSIKNFEAASKTIAPTAESLASTKNTVMN